MALAQAVGVSAFVLVSLVVGLRLIGLSRRAHRVPALSIGLTFLLSGGIGFPLLFAALVLPDSLGEALAFVQVAGLVSVNLGALSLWLFTWRTFRPADTWATALVACAAATLCVSFAMQAIGSGFGTSVGSGPWFWIQYGARALAAVWAAVESLRYYGLMRRRQRLGLAEPLLVNRFLLWGVSAVAAASMSAVSAVTLVVAPTADPALVVAVRLLGSAIGLLAAIATWLAFFPPAVYRRRFDAGEPAGAAS